MEGEKLRIHNLFTQSDGHTGDSEYQTGADEIPRLEEQEQGRKMVTVPPREHSPHYHLHFRVAVQDD